MERETIGPGHPLQSRIRSVQRTDGADHESFTSLLWADGYAVGDGTAQNLRHGIGILGGVEVQPGLLGILLQQALAFQATPYPLTDPLHQILEFTFIRCPDALKPGWSVVAIYIDAIQE